MTLVRARGAVVAALLITLALGACTPGPTPAPAPSVQTPTETAAERQERLDYAAAEKAYRTFRAEYGRVLRAGGAKEPTKVMKETAGGEYLATFAEVARGYKLAGSREVGAEEIVYVHRGGYGEASLVLRVCEDSRRSKTMRKDGTFANGEVRTATLELRRHGHLWKVWTGTGKRVKLCE